MQACLDKAWTDSSNDANSLVQQLLTEEQARLNLFSMGSIGSVSKNSTSQSYTGPSGASLTVLQMQKLYRMLINLYRQKKCETDRLFENSIAWFLAKYTTYATDADQAVYDFMVRWLSQDWETYQCDMTDLRLPFACSDREGVVTW